MKIVTVTLDYKTLLVTVVKRKLLLQANDDENGDDVDIVLGGRGYGCVLQSHTGREEKGFDILFVKHDAECNRFILLHAFRR